MRKRNVLYGIAASFLIILTSCSKLGNGQGKLYTPTAADVTANATLDELKQGRALYVANCGECHYLYSPDDFPASSWGSILSRMGPYTPMSQDEIKLVKEYVTRGE